MLNFKGGEVMMDIINTFFSGELNQDMYEAMRNFLISPEIREGKFEGNEILINKLNRNTAIVYKEYELKDGSFEYSSEGSICEIDNLVRLLDETMKSSIYKELELGKYRIIKIGRNALYELIYEHFISQQFDFFEVNPVQVMDSFEIDFENGEFIFMVHKCEDGNKNLIPLPKEIDLIKLMKNMKDTTNTIFQDNRYIELTLDDIIVIQNK
ncbi:MAG: hypothetical protein K0S41_1475 [Anaerocolumna sp.]|jgi:hypothetical protein|nr:hypothetical protein [Anaerocolumna sp.]